MRPFIHHKRFQAAHGVSELLIARFIINTAVKLRRIEPLVSQKLSQRVNQHTLVELGVSPACGVVYGERPQHLLADHILPADTE